MKRSSIFTFLLVSFLASGMIFSVQVSFSCASEDTITTVVWEYGEEGAAHGYTKASLLSEANASSYYITIDKYDVLGDLTGVHADNQSGGFLWKSPADLEILTSEGAYLENLTIAGKEITVVVYEFVYDQQVTMYKYDNASGVLASSQSESDNEAFSRLISWEDLDVKIYAEDQNQFIGAYPLWGVFLSVIGIMVSGRIKPRAS